MSDLDRDRTRWTHAGWRRHRESLFLTARRAGKTSRAEVSLRCSGQVGGVRGSSPTPLTLRRALLGLHACHPA